MQIGWVKGGLNALFLAAGAMSLANPNLPWDVSFQLSFAATFGLVVYAARLEDRVLGLAEWPTSTPSSVFVSILRSSYLKFSILRIS